MQLTTALTSLLLLASTALACVQADFYYEQNNHERLYGLMKDNGVPFCGIAKQGIMRVYRQKGNHWWDRLSKAYDLDNRCEDMECRDPKIRAQICRAYGDYWQVNVMRDVGAVDGVWPTIGFNLKVDVHGNEERRLTEAVWGCTDEQIAIKGVGFPNAEVHA